MTVIRRVRSENIIMGTFSHGGDLLGEITDVCSREKVSLGRIEGIGSVQRARLGYYNQDAREYRYLNLNEPLEITCLSGNVSLKKENPFVHAHLTLANERGMVFGGHLTSGTVIFAFEFVIETFEGPGFSREYDSVTGLALWEDPEEAGD